MRLATMADDDEQTTDTSKVLRYNGIVWMVHTGSSSGNSTARLKLASIHCLSFLRTKISAERDKNVNLILMDCVEQIA